MRLTTLPAIATLTLGLLLPDDTRADSRLNHHPLTVLCLGDSLTEGFGVAEAEAYPAILEDRLHAAGYTGARVINAGVTASTSASGMSRLQERLPAQPDLLILELGINDGLRGLPLEEIRANLTRTIALAKDHGVPVLLAATMLPPGGRAAYERGFRGLFKVIAREQKVALVSLPLDLVATRPELQLPHNLHPNARGYQLIADAVLKAVLLRYAPGWYDHCAAVADAGCGNDHIQVSVRDGNRGLIRATSERIATRLVTQGVRPGRNVLEAEHRIKDVNRSDRAEWCERDSPVVSKCGGCAWQSRGQPAAPKRETAAYADQEAPATSRP
ncbi:MAG TPA: arylesterase [Candidatus Binatia bacterium]|nr:arylesterase [Candidatus Binatia bacterium]